MIDYRKAFDTVDHQILLAKMERYGIRGVVLELFSSYLSHRSHRVKIGKAVSTKLTIDIGVPQGSLLGPILFILYINDLFYLPNFPKPILYADDTTLLFRNENSDALIQQCNDGLARFQSWSISNKLSINEEKSCYITFTLRDFTCNEKLILNGKYLERRNQYKYLGVDIDDTLKFNLHMIHVAKKNSKSIGILYRLRDMIPLTTKIQIYNTLVLPYLSY